MVAANLKTRINEHIRETKAALSCSLKNYISVLLHFIKVVTCCHILHFALSVRMNGEDSAQGLYSRCHSVVTEEYLDQDDTMSEVRTCAASPVLIQSLLSKHLHRPNRNIILSVGHRDRQRIVL